jgi:hypothetical protein
MIRFLRRLFRRHVNHMALGSNGTTFCGRPARKGPVSGDPYCSECVQAAARYHNETADQSRDMCRRLDAVANIVASDKPFDPAMLYELAERLFPDVEGLTDVLDAMQHEREVRQP